MVGQMMSDEIACEDVKSTKTVLRQKNSISAKHWGLAWVKIGEVKKIFATECYWEIGEDQKYKTFI